MDTEVRNRSIANIDEEVKYLIDRYDIDSLYFFDPTFTIDKKRTIELADKIKDFALDWTCQTRVDQVDRDILRSLKFRM